MIMNPFPFGFPPVRRPYSKYNPPPHNFAEVSKSAEHKVHLQDVVSSNDNGRLKNGLLSNDNVSTNEDEFFEIFGLKLHFDDLLIIAILFFLYQEEVKDTYLYIALILLLLS